MECLARARRARRLLSQAPDLDGDDLATFCDGPTPGRAANGQLLRQPDSSWSPRTAAGDGDLVLLTASEEGLQRRYTREPDLYFSLATIQAANRRFPSLLPLLPRSVPHLHLDTTTMLPDAVFTHVAAFVHDPQPAT